MIDCTEGVSRILFPVRDLRPVAGVDRHDAVTPSNLLAGLMSHGYEWEEVSHANETNETIRGEHQ